MWIFKAMWWCSKNVLALIVWVFDLDPASESKSLCSSLNRSGCNLSMLGEVFASPAPFGRRNHSPLLAVVFDSQTVLPLLKKSGLKEKGREGWMFRIFRLKTLPAPQQLVNTAISTISGYTVIFNGVDVWQWYSTLWKYFLPFLFFQQLLLFQIFCCFHHKQLLKYFKNKSQFFNYPLLKITLQISSSFQFSGVNFHFQFLLKFWKNLLKRFLFISSLKNHCFINKAYTKLLFPFWGQETFFGFLFGASFF